MLYNRQYILHNTVKDNDYLEGIKKVLSEGNAKQLDTIPLKLPESLPSND